CREGFQEVIVSLIGVGARPAFVIWASSGWDATKILARVFRCISTDHEDLFHASFYVWASSGVVGFVICSDHCSSHWSQVSKWLYGTIRRTYGVNTSRGGIFAIP